MDRLSAYNLALRWFESRCHRKESNSPRKKRNIFVTIIVQVEHEIKEQLSRSACNKLNRPTSEMPGKHQPSAFSTNIFISESMYNCDFFCLPSGNIPSCSHLCPKRRVGWAQFDRRAHVAKGLAAIRAVCRAWQAFQTFLALGTLEGNPRVSATPPAIGFLHTLYPCTHVRFGCKPSFSARRGYTHISLFLHRAPRYDTAYQHLSSHQSAACNSMCARLLLL